MMLRTFLLIAFLAPGPFANAVQAEGGSVEITQVRPTIFFPKAVEGEPLRQRAELGLESTAGAKGVSAKIHAEGGADLTETLGDIPTGRSVWPIHVPDISVPTKVTFEIFQDGNPRPIAKKTLTWQPQKKWKVYYVSFSHHDMGYADYYHMMRRDVRELGIERALEFCANRRLG